MATDVPREQVLAILEIISLLEENSTAALPTDVIASLARRLRVPSLDAALIFTSVGNADYFTQQLQPDDSGRFRYQLTTHGYASLAELRKPLD